jgi:hypothetical protein
VSTLHLGQEDGPLFYGLITDTGAAADAKMFLRANRDASSAVSAIPAVVRRLDPNVTVTTESYQQILSEQLLPARRGATLVSALGLLALVLAIVGVTGVVSLATSQRVREICVRIAFGARRHDVLVLLLGHGVKLVAIGLLAGLALAAGSAVLLASNGLLFGVSPIDPAVFWALRLCCFVLPCRQCYFSHCVLSAVIRPSHCITNDFCEIQLLTTVHRAELESRLSGLSRELEAGVDPEQIAKLLGESLRQHFLNSGIPDTVKGLQATSIAMTTAQKELSTALRSLSDSRGAVTQIESANNRLTCSLENRAKAVDALLHEVKSDLLRIWIPLIAGATLLIGLFGGIAIQGWRDSVPTAATPPTIAEPVPLPEPQQSPRSARRCKAATP